MLPRVLVVDDNAVNRQIVEWALEGRAEVTGLEDGRKCCDWLATSEAAAVFLDLMMPGYSGFDVLAEMQRRMPDRLRKTVVITARDDSAAKQEAKAFGVGAFARKPLTIEEIVRLFLEPAAR